MEEEMRQLRKVFMTVRLMKADEVQGGKKGSAPCYAQWRRSRPCENCVARQALEKNTRKTRLEYFGQELYEITASCVQVAVPFGSKFSANGEPIYFSVGPTAPAAIRWMINTVFMAVMSMILTCITAAMAGYALAKKRFVGRKLLFTLIVCAMALPKQVILIPLLREMSSLNLYNTIWAVIFPIVGWPFGVFLMKQFSEGIPTEMLEAARIDGASEAKTFIDIVLPMVKPGIGALAIFTFINSWNDYFMQLIMLSSTSNLTISLGIAKLQAENSTDFGLIMAGAALAAVPIIIIFLIFQKYFTKGIAMGAVKG